MEPQGNTKLLERFAVARLQYTVNELQTKVDSDKSLVPPVRRVFRCIADDSALTTSIADFKSWISDGSVSMVVPLYTLDALDDQKKGTDTKNVNSRETIRYFERCQRKPVRGVKIQDPKEMFSSWAECEQFRLSGVATPSSSPPMDGGVNGNGNSHWRRSRAEALGLMVPPRWLQPVLNCALFRIHGSGGGAAGDAEGGSLLVTNNEDAAGWARAFGIRAVDTATLGQMIERESWDFHDKQQRYEASVVPNSPTGMRRGGRSGGFSKGGRGGGRGGGRRDSRAGNEPPVDPEFSRGNHPSPDYILRGAPRGVPRGRGKLWEP